MEEETKLKDVEAKTGSAMEEIKREEELVEEQERAGREGHRTQGK